MTAWVRMAHVATPSRLVTGKRRPNFADSKPCAIQDAHPLRASRRACVRHIGMVLYVFQSVFGVSVHLRAGDDLRSTERAGGRPHHPDLAPASGVSSSCFIEWQPNELDSRSCAQQAQSMLRRGCSNRSSSAQKREAGLVPNRHLTGDCRNTTDDRPGAVGLRELIECRVTADVEAGRQGSRAR
jgi:hypothetical protein